MTRRYEYFDDARGRVDRTADWEEVSVVYKGQTDKAWWVNPGFGADVAIPKSESELELGDSGKASTLKLPTWLAKAKGLI